MNATNSIDFAYSLGAEMARQLNADPKEAQNWSALEPNDDLPEFDYVTLRDQFGITPQVERAYRDGFNATFIYIGK